MTPLARRASGTAPRAVPRPAGERRRQIVEAAIVEFSTRGYREVGTSDVARRVGVSEPAIYRHFSSKLEIYLAALDHSTRTIDEAWRSLAAQGPTPLDALRAIGRWCFEQLRAGPPHLALRARALVETSEPAAVERLRVHFDDTRGMIERLYPRARAWAFMAIGALLDRTQLLGLAAELDAAALRDVLASLLPELAGRRPARAAG
jgi:AcrR family transcriptional regulator